MSCVAGNQYRYQIPQFKASVARTARWGGVRGGAKPETRKAEPYTLTWQACCDGCSMWVHASCGNIDSATCVPLAHPRTPSHTLTLAHPRTPSPSHTLTHPRTPSHPPHKHSYLRTPSLTLLQPPTPFYTFANPEWQHRQCHDRPPRILVLELLDLLELFNPNTIPQNPKPQV